MFGLNNDSIMIGKSPLVGVQVSRNGNDLIIQGTPPKVLAGILSLILTLAGLAEYTIGFKKLEKEVAVFLQKKFH